MILLPWQFGHNFYIRQIYPLKPDMYCAIIHYEDKYYYHAQDLQGKPIFKHIGAVDSDYVGTLEEAKQIVDDALTKAGFRLLNEDDERLLILI